MCEEQPGPDESVAYVQEINVYDDAEDVKRVEFVGGSKSVTVGITDDVMVEFVEVAEQVFKDIHGDMTEIRDLFEREDSDSED